MDEIKPVAMTQPETVSVTQARNFLAKIGK